MCKNMCLIKKREIDKSFSLKETLGYSHKQVHIELIERSHILDKLWNWSEDWKASWVQYSILFWISLHQGTLPCFLFLKLRHCMLSHMNEVDPLYSTACFYMRYKTIISMCFPNKYMKHKVGILCGVS